MGDDPGSARSLICGGTVVAPFARQTATSPTMTLVSEPGRVNLAGDGDGGFEGDSTTYPASANGEETSWRGTVEGKGIRRPPRTSKLRDSAANRHFMPSACMSRPALPIRACATWTGGRFAKHQEQRLKGRTSSPIRGLQPISSRSLRHLTPPIWLPTIRRSPSFLQWR